MRENVTHACLNSSMSWPTREDFTYACLNSSRSRSMRKDVTYACLNCPLSNKHTRFATHRISALECQIEGQACLLIFHFLPTCPKLIWAYRFIFSRVVWQPVLSFKSDWPAETIHLVNFDYFTCHLWALCHLFSVYIAVIIHILHDKKQSLLKLLSLQGD